jgi:hypothetical protein
VLRNLLQAIDKKYHVERTGKIDKTSNSHASAEVNSSKSPKVNAGKGYQGNKISKKPASSSPWVEGARPNASNIYENPNSKTNPKRKQLKLSK